MQRVAITGLGVLSPIGLDKASFLDSLRQGRSGLRWHEAQAGDLSARRVAGVCDFDPKAVFTRQELSGADRVGHMAVAAAMQAVDDAGLALADVPARRVGVSLGTSLGGANSLNDMFVQLFQKDPNRVPPFSVLMIMANGPTCHVASRYQAQGPTLTHSCACASSNVAIGEALRQIRHGVADVMLVGGTESQINYGSMKGWEAMRVLGRDDPVDPSRSCKPFSRNRTGLIIGEGAAMFVLERLDHALARGARIYAELAGYACTNDPRHITRPSAEGQGQTMAQALQDAGVPLDAVDYINAHGTATQANDATETAAIRQVFGAHAQRLAVSSTKSMHGHLLGAAGAVELAACLLAMEQRFLPPTAGEMVPDPECDLDYVPGTARENVRVDTVMSNSFAFGGTNTALVLRRP